MIEKNFKKITKEEVEKECLKYFNGDELATSVWINKYCLKDENNLYELTPDDMHVRIANELSRIENKYPNPRSFDNIYGRIKNFKRIVPQGSPMAGIGNDFQTTSLSNCFVVGNKKDSDSYGGILKIDQELVQLQKRRGGVGTDLSFIRPAGSPVKNSAITSTGVVPFMKRYSNSTNEVAQDGRRGALMLSLSIKHPDAENFIDAKLQKGQVTGANISVKIDDEFMQAVINKKPYLQRYPIDVPYNLDSGFRCDFNEMEYNKIYKGALGLYKKIDAEKLWKKIIHNAWASAEPGILFWDTIINESIPDCYTEEGFKTISTNPCFRGDMNLLTSEGYKTFKELSHLKNCQLINKNNEVVNGKVWSNGIKDVYRVKTWNEDVFYCTKEHKFLTIDNEELSIKDCVGKRLMPFYEINKSISLFTKLGFIQGDGGLGRLQSTAHKGLEINIGAKDKDIANLFNLEYNSNKRAYYTNEYNTILNELEFDSNKLPKRILPKTFNNWTIKQKSDFLKGLWSANGSIIKNTRIALKSTCGELINQLKIVLYNEFGINSYITTNKVKKIKFSNGEYECKESYDLNISTFESILLFAKNIGFIHNYKNIELEKTILNKAPLVRSVKFNSKEEVFDFNLNDDTHWGVVNGVIAHNCGEITLCSNDSCRLLLLNLFGYVINPFTKNAKFNWDLFKEDAIEAQRYMDDIIDLEIEKIDKILEKVKSDPEDDFIKLYEIKLWEEIRNMAVKGRRTGLGVTGEGDMLAALGLTYGTDEATDFSVSVHKELKLSAYRSSVELAKERGCFPVFNKDNEINNPFILRIKEENYDLYKDMQLFGRRNIALLTIAPAGSVSICTQTTSGIEPAFMVLYKRRRKINPQEKNARVDFVDDEGVAWMEYPVFHKNFELWLEINGYDINTVRSMTDIQLNEIIKQSPYYKGTAHDINWVKKVEMQGKIQKHVDHSISMTTNIPSDTTEETVSKIYETGWKFGCKGVTIYRDGSRAGILVSNNENKTEQKKEEKLTDTYAPKRSKRLKGKIHRFQNNLEKWIAVVGLKDGRPYEIFTGKLENGLSNLPPNIEDCEVVKNIIEIIDENGEKIKKKRYDIEYIDAEGIKHTHTGLNHAFNPEFWNYAKFISGILRHGMPLVYVVELIGSLNFKEDYINTWKNGVMRTLKKYIADGSIGSGVCPICGSDHLEYKEGCLTCMSCGNSKCN